MQSLIDIYRLMNPTDLGKEYNGVKIGDTVRYSQCDKHLVDRAKGKLAGKVLEIRSGRSGPLVIESRGVGNNPIAYHIGEVKAVFRIDEKNDLGFAYDCDIEVVKE